MESNILFAGSFTNSFDFEPIREAALRAQNIGRKWRFILCGNGDNFDKVENMMKDLKNVFFPGWIDTNKINVLSKMSIATIAPYKNTENFMNNIPNKVVDSLGLGLPVLSPLKGEVGNLISNHKVGLSYNKETSLFQCIDSIVNDKALHQDLSKNAKEIYTNSFEFNKVYDDFILNLEYLASTQSKL
jgi:glycosyltransferase involved in cell wall biosynthesis